HLRRLDGPARRGDPADAAVGDVELFQPAAEAVLAAERLDLPPEVAADEREAVAAEVRPAFIQQRRFPAALDEPLEHPIDVRSRKPASELAVAEAAGPALAEEVVVLGIVRSAAIERADGGNAFLHRLPALDDQRPV